MLNSIFFKKDFFSNDIIKNYLGGPLPPPGITVVSRGGRHGRGRRRRGGCPPKIQAIHIFDETTYTAFPIQNVLQISYSFVFSCAQLLLVSCN